jgi:WD40 repeat protein/serine/threonine protein kinase
LLDQYLALRLGGEGVEIEGFLADHPELEEAERERLRRLTGLLRKPVEGSPESAGHAPPQRDPTGEQVGPYRILRELGRGGQGAVFLAEDTRFARKVALKVLTRHGLELRDDPQGRESFARLKREAEVLSRLDHPGICVVYEMGTERNDLYIAMRYVEGQTLAKKITDARPGSAAPAKSDDPRGRPVALPGSDGAPAGPGTPPSTGRRSIERVLALIEQSARALHVAHEAGVVHRDVKPGNIMVTPQGDPVLLDFGLARDLEHGTEALTASGGVLGTPAYMSPEQLTPARGSVDRRTDVYALGVTLYECLTLRRPFEAPTREQLFRLILSEQPSRPGGLNASIPRDLEVVLETAMAKDVDHRYQTTLDFAEDLRRVRAREPIRARPAGVVLRFTRWIQRNPVLAAALAGAFLALASGLGVALHLLRQESAALKRERAALAKSEGNRLLAESRAILPTNPCLALLLAIEGAPKAPGLTANNALLQAIGELRERRMLETHPQLLVCLPSPDERLLVTVSRDGTARVWDAVTWDQLEVLEGHTGEVSDAVFSPDGSLLATAANDGTCRVWSTDTWITVHELRETHPHVVVFAFDAAGQHLLTGSVDAFGRQDTHVWNVDRETALHARDLQGSGINSGAFSREGRHLLTVGDAGARLWQVEHAALRSVFEYPNPVPDKPLLAILSPDGDRVLVEWQGGACLLDANTWEELFPLDLKPINARLLAFRADGGRLLVAQNMDGRAEVWDVRSERLVCELKGTRTACGLASFSPDGTRILAVSEDWVARLWDAESGEELATFQGHESNILSAHFSRSGLAVITAATNGTIREWELESEAQRTTLADLGLAGPPSFDSTGKRVAAEVDAGGIRLIGLDSRENSRSLAVPEFRPVSMAFAPDGHSLVMTQLEGDRPGSAASSWEVETGEQLAVFQHPEGTEVYDARFSPDGQLVVTAADDHNAYIWDAQTGDLVLPLSGHTGGVRSAAFGPAGKRIITTSEDLKDSSVRIWDAESGIELVPPLRAEGARPIFACLSPDGRRALAGCWWGKACVWDVSSGELIRCWSANSSHLSTAVFSPDGTRILTAPGISGACLWDAGTLEEVMTLPWQQSGVYGAFSADGCWIVTVSPVGARLWPVDPLKQAQRLHPRKLTSEECARYDIAPR